MYIYVIEVKFLEQHVIIIGMKNLRITQYEKWKPPHSRHITATAWDVTSDSLLCTLGPSESNAEIELIRVNLKSKPPNHESIISWDCSGPNPDSECDKIIDLHYFADKSMSCLVMAKGDVIVIREQLFANEERNEIVGSIDEGITAAEWSSDEELLAITTRVNTIVFMSRNFEGVVEASMTSEDLKLSKQVSVGWGKKETQFRGRGARALKDPTMPEKIDEGVLTPYEDFRVYMSWRGDGAFIAVSSVEAGKRRVFRIYSREGVLDSVSEPVDGLEGALSWRPAGNLIAGVQVLGDNVNIVFFERNGLRHGEFRLRLTSTQYQSSKHQIQLNWNPDSTVLAVVMENHIEFWTMNNYHWYLKQQVHYNSSATVLSLKWNPEKPLRCMLTLDESITIIEQIFVVTRTAIIPPQDYGVVAVIDGKIAKITPLRAANIPPPMSLHEIEAKDNIIDISFNDLSFSIAILHQTGISVFNWKNVADPSTVPCHCKEIPLPQSSLSDNMYQQISWGYNNQVVTLHKCNSMSHLTRFRLDIDCNETDVIEPIEMKILIKPSSISTLFSLSEESQMNTFAQSTDGEILCVDHEEHSFPQLKLSLYLPWIHLIKYNDSIFVVGMSNKGFLYANSKLLAKNCTSFVTTDAHIIFTTASHFLKFMHITEIENLEVPPDDIENDERCRSIERGARIVTAIPSELSLILQMPRGNLETIYPRAMVLAGVRKLIKQMDYKKAFEHCRTHRLDMNLLYDYDSEQFLSNVGLFVSQIKKTTYLDLFLSSLSEEDVTQTIYKEVKNPIAKDSTCLVLNKKVENDSLYPVNKISKINKICDACLRVFQTKTAENLQNMITAYVCKSPPALVDGLLVLGRLIKDSSHLVERAVEHICFLTDVNKLYDSALGLYDIELALLLVQNSQKDPREYLPFLQSLQEVSPLRRQFRIDNFLGRYEKALAWLHELDAYTEFQAYTQKHSLYPAALSLCRYNETKHAEIMLLYADYLESKSNYSAAALAYESLSDYAKATSCYLTTGSSYWRQALSCALSQSPPVSGSALIDMATNLYEALFESKEYYAAATIQLEYLSSVSGACHAFCKGYFFTEAFHLCTLKQQKELVHSIIEPSLVESFASSTELIADCKAQIMAQVPRIRELRQRSIEDPLAFYQGERGAGDLDIPDDISVVLSSNLSTNRSLFTRYTGKTGKNTIGTTTSRATSKHRKKEERKRAQGKKGSIYEEEYLVNSVERLIQRVERARGDIDRLLKAMIRRGMWERARALELALENLVKLYTSIVPEIFISEPAIPVVNLNQDRIAGGITAIQETRKELGDRKIIPIIAPFEKLSLLG
ncbi:putative iki3 family protein [Erysiphe necator]|uniref:Elongator complex protein 1 n=1 Tax=Uncinula necator TaxID=52586 RepID=A0A0B1PB74_UNCNE|nr:putative iki3 family protein [Erysiphe necator]